MTNFNSQQFDRHAINRGLWAAIIMALVELIIFGYTITLPRLVWHDYFLTVLPGILFLISLTCVFIIRRGMLALGTGMVFLGTLFLGVVTILFQDNLGTFGVSYLLVVSSIFIFKVIPQSSRRWGLISAGISILSCIVIEILDPEFRVSTPELLTFFPLISGLLIIAFAFILASQIRARLIPISYRFLAALLTIFMIVATIGMLVWNTLSNYQSQLDQMIIETAKSKLILQTQEAIWNLLSAEIQLVNDPDNPNNNFQFQERMQDLRVFQAQWLSFEQISLLNKYQASAEITLQGVEEGNLAQAEANIRSTSLILANEVNNSLAELQSDTPLSQNITTIRNIQQSLLSTLLIGAVVAVSIMLFVGTTTARSITLALNELVDVTNAYGRGDRTARAPEANDEIGALARSFNQTTEQLNNLYSSLEDRIEDRTLSLRVSNEISQRLSTMLDYQQLIDEVVDQLHKKLNFYHTHIYLYDEALQELHIAGGSGEPGKKLLQQQHSIPLGKGLVGKAAARNQVLLASDVSLNPDWIFNQMLPDTKSELAVPISLGARVIGVLDIQHNQVDALTNNDVDLLQSIASQMAIALQNAQTYSEIHRRAERDALLVNIGQNIQNATSIQEAMQVVAQNIGQSLNVKKVQVNLSTKQYS